MENLKTELQSLKNKLTDLSKDPIDEDNYKNLIGLLIKQNSLIETVFELTDKMIESHKIAATSMTKVMDSHNENFDFIKNWLESQSSRNDSVDRELNRINKKIEG